MQNNKNFNMMPIAPLMIEHRLIEKMIKLMEKELHKINQGNEANPVFIEKAVDFFGTYADRCHHGKEEDILFRELAKKKLSSEHRKMMDELINEHIFGRKIVGRLANAKDKYTNTDYDTTKEIVECLKTLVGFYPSHIKKEDKQFFIPCMEYFSQEEKDEMLDECWEFDRNIIHEKYQNIVKQLGA
ncbi:MAG TPA: hemerythrin domain-containing protein [candidate division Zixibacteria bacterium]